MPTFNTGLPLAPTIPGTSDGIGFGRDIKHRDVPIHERGDGAANALVVIIILAIAGTWFLKSSKNRDGKKKKQKPGRKDGAVV